MPANRTVTTATQTVTNGLEDLAAEFWSWRARTQPRLRDDIPRLERPVGWVPDFGAAAVTAQRLRRDEFAARLAGVQTGTPSDRVDARLLRSAVSRVTWELDMVAAWQRQPRFYIDQTLGPVFDLLVVPGVNEARVVAVLGVLDAVAPGLAVARENLAGHAYAEFAELAIAELDGIEFALAHLGVGLAAVAPEQAEALRARCGRTAAEFRSFGIWLREQLPSFRPAEPIGADAFAWFLAEVACIPLPAREIEAIGRREHDRATVLEMLERRRVADVPEPPLPADGQTQARREVADELAVREFYVSRGLLSQPDDLGHYLTAPIPDFLQPLAFLGVADDLTGPSRLDENGISWFPEPTAELPYFYAANARDPRAGIVHEGAHYQQLALSWRRARPVRRHYYDSGANEGIAFYNEELMLAAGLFDDAPHTRVTMANFMRLRALRVIVDTGLATGRLTISDAANLLEHEVPMDHATATEEAAFFAETPGQALTYQIGKTQILALIADAVRVQGASFDLHALHDSLWINGNVPIALQRYEMLGLTDELAAIGMPVTES